jgi:RNA polymerase sigma factor (sigma-70 family)
MFFRNWLQIKEAKGFDMDTLSDNELVQAAHEGNREAMDILLRRWIPRLTPWIASRTYDKHDVDDIIQGAIVRILQAFKNGSIPRNFGTWAHQVARNQSVDVGREKSRQPVAVSEPENVRLMQGDKRIGTTPLTTDPNVNDPAEIYAQADMAKAVHKALSDLAATGEYGAKKVAIIRSFYFDQEKIQYIADKMQLPLGTVKRILHSGRKDLLRLLGSQDIDD